MRLLTLCVAMLLVSTGSGLSQATNNMLSASTSVNYALVADPRAISLSNLQSITFFVTGYDANGDALILALLRSHRKAP